VTDKLRSYGVAQRKRLPKAEHRQSRHLNNRAETRIVRHAAASARCNDSNHLSRPTTFSPRMHSSTVHFHPRRHLLAASAYHALRTKAFNVWQQDTVRPKRSVMCATKSSRTSGCPVKVNVTMPEITLFDRLYENFSGAELTDVLPIVAPLIEFCPRSNIDCTQAKLAAAAAMSLPLSVMSLLVKFSYLRVRPGTLRSSINVCRASPTQRSV
jgi:hypothetical protein